MEDTPDEPQPGEFVELDAETREAVSKFLPFAEAMTLKVADEAMQASRWLLASLLAVNGGALVAALSSDKVSAEALRVAGPSWLLGLILALTVGVSNLLIGTLGMRIMGNWVGKAQAGLGTGWIEMPDWKADTARLNRVRKWPWIIGTLSAAAFITGAVAAGVHMVRHPPTETKAQPNPPNLPRTS